MASLFNTGSIWAAIEQSATVDTVALSTSMLTVIFRPEALAFLFAFFFNMPCLMALTATAQETHSLKWTVRIALYYILDYGNDCVSRRSCHFLKESLQIKSQALKWT